MKLTKIGNAPCSWGIEFADDPRNPPWQTVLTECKQAGYNGIELGPYGYMPQDGNLLQDNLSALDLQIIAGVIFQPFHNPDKWPHIKQVAKDYCAHLAQLDAKELVLIDSISPQRAPTAGRKQEAVRMPPDQWKEMMQKIDEVCKIAKDHNLRISMHAHAAGYCEFEDEIEKILNQFSDDTIGICLDTGHAIYAGYDPFAFMRKYASRVHYIHLKNINRQIMDEVILKRTGFYDACAQGIFCLLKDGTCDFAKFRDLLLELGYTGWCTVEQDCDPSKPAFADVEANYQFLKTICPS